MEATGTSKENRDYMPRAAVSIEDGTRPGEVPIHVKDLQKSFGEQHVLRGITFEVRQGQTLFVLGRSGTGKSVLLKLIVGLQDPDSGSICVHGKEIAGLPMKHLNEVRKKIGFLFQNAALYDSLSVEENVAFPLRRHAKLSDADRHKKVQELLASVGLEKDSQKMPGEISGGMQKRVGLARALALDPDILLFDEPTAGLDPITSEEISQLILKLQKERNMASIVVTHDIHSARTVSDRVALLRDGQILIQGTFENLEKSKEEYVMQFLNDGCTGDKNV
jgi:phospholipid/cholesterol/gamma-HCH transport system ATP-binding protein